MVAGTSTCFPSAYRVSASTWGGSSFGDGAGGGSSVSCRIGFAGRTRSITSTNPSESGVAVTRTAASTPGAASGSGVAASEGRDPVVGEEAVSVGDDGITVVVPAGSLGKAPCTANQTTTRFTATAAAIANARQRIGFSSVRELSTRSPRRSVARRVAADGCLTLTRGAAPARPATVDECPKLGKRGLPTG